MPTVVPDSLVVHIHHTPAEITELVWTRLGSRGCQLGIRRSEGPTINFLGFKDKVGAQGRGQGWVGGCVGSKGL